MCKISFVVASKLSINLSCQLSVDNELVLSLMLRYCSLKVDIE